MSLDKEGFALFHVEHQGKPLVVDSRTIGGYIVRTLKETMERNLSMTAPNLAVVSVPAEFNQLQRNHTALAATQTGVYYYTMHSTQRGD